MRATIIVIIAALLITTLELRAQERTICGRVISDLDKDPVPFALIWDKNNFTLGKTGLDGRFRINVPANTEVLVFGLLGFERAKVYLTSNCDTVDLVLMEAATYDFMSSRKIDKKRLASFKNLTNVYSQAYQKGLFSQPTPCYNRDFEPEKPSLDSTQRRIEWEGQQAKLAYSKLTIGDTVRIPFFITHNEPRSDTASLGYYSLSPSNAENYDYIVRGVIIDKNRHKRRYNLVIKITGCDLCKQPARLQGQPMKTDEVFTYNMGYFKVLTE